MDARLKKALEANREELVSTLQELIRHPSTKGNEESAQVCFAEKLRALGGDVDMWEPDIEAMRKIPHFYTDRESYKGSPVLAATFKGSGGGKSLILCGHMDVVPAVAEYWSMDPYAGILKDDRVYGRGAADMKGGIAANFIALKSILDAGIRLKGDVIVETSVDEEVGNTGILALCQKYTADAAIVPEPTALEMNVATGGSRMYEISVPGKAAHVGTSYKGENAIYKAIPLINAIRDLQERRRIRLMDPLYADRPIPFCTGVTMIKAGEWRATVPSEAVVTGRLGIAPSESMDDAMAELEDAIMSQAGADPWLRENPPKITYFPSLWQSGHIDVDHPLVRMIARNSREITGVEARVSGMSACSDSGTLIKVGNVPAVNFGPNTMEMAHQNDEFVDLPSLFACADITAQTIVDFCGAE